MWVAEQLAASLPHAHLEVLPPGGVLVRHRRVMRDLIGGFLSGESPSTRHHLTAANPPGFEENHV